MVRTPAQEALQAGADHELYARHGVAPGLHRHAQHGGAAASRSWSAAGPALRHWMCITYSSCPASAGSLVGVILSVACRYTLNLSSFSSMFSASQCRSKQSWPYLCHQTQQPAG